MDISPDPAFFDVYNIEPLENTYLVEMLFIEISRRQGFDAFLRQIKRSFSLSDIQLCKFDVDNNCLEILASADIAFDHSPFFVKPAPYQQSILKSWLALKNDMAQGLSTLCIKQVGEQHIMSNITLVKSSVVYFLELKKNKHFSIVEQQHFSALLFHFKIALEIYDQADRKRRFPTIEKIRQIFPITITEAINCQFIMQGKGLKEIAYLRNVSVHTVREQMRQVYLKTALHNQKKVISAIYEAID